MSGPGLFVVGMLVTVIVAAALVLLFYAAVLDGRYAKAQPPAAEPPEPTAIPEAMGVTSVEDRRMIQATNGIILVIDHLVRPAGV